MGNNFWQFKRKARIQSIASSILLGLSAGLLLTSVLTVISKTAGREVDRLYYLIGIGAALVISVALYFIFMPSNRRLAARLDKLYSLDEKIRTMVEFDGNEGGFYRIQREDAEAQLGEKPRKMMKSRALFTGLVSIAVSVGLFIGAVIMPVRVSENLEFEEPIDQFDKDWILASLSELIVTVRNSFMPDDLKNATIQELQDLVDFVEGSVLMSEMKAKAIGTVAAIDSLVDNANTAVNIGEKLALSTNPSVADLGEQMKLLSAPEAQRAFSELGDALRTYDAETRKAIAGEIDSLIDESGVSASDPLHQLMRKITTAMNTGSAGATSSAFEQALPEVFEKVQLQSLNAYTGGYVITEICNLFGITADDLANENIEIVIPEQGTPDLDPDVGGGNDDDDDDDKPLGPGGLGTGEIIYGSNDMIFDPNKNEYVSYGELLNEYYAKVSEMINDGKTSDEVAELADYYYGLLFGSHNSSGN